jgi:hypothetical protein
MAPAVNLICRLFKDTGELREGGPKKTILSDDSFFLGDDLL